jgi:hypothetical protein
MAMKTYPMEIGLLYEDGSLCGYYSQGHHDPEMFVEAVWLSDDREIDVSEVKHDFRRWEICYGPDEWVRCLNTPRDGTTRRGVFPVTIVEWY